MRISINFFFIVIPLCGIGQSTFILPGAVEFPHVSSLPTCNTVSEGRQVYRTTDHKMYYCNGSGWQEMSGGSFSLPYYGTGNESSDLAGLFSITNTTGSGIRGQSNSGRGIWGISNTNIGVFGFSNTGRGGYFQNSSSTNATLYAKNFGTGLSAEFGGDVSIIGELEVANGKGIIQSSNGVQLKYAKTLALIEANMSANGTFITDEIELVSYSQNPTVFIGDVYNQSGDYYKVMVTPVAVTHESVRLRFFNPTNSQITFSGTWKIISIGPK